MNTRNMFIKGVTNTEVKEEYYPFLFHRFQESNNSTIQIESHQHTTMVLRNHYAFIAHLHCFNIDEFKSFYEGDLVERIVQHCKLVIVTFCEGDITKKSLSKNQTQIIYLRIKNKGMDIGGKCCCLFYLKQCNIYFDHILFLHSKSCPIRRTMYFRPLIDNLPSLVESFSRHPNRGVYVPPLLHCGDYNNRILLMNRFFPFQKQAPWNEGNDMYMKELDAMMGLDPHNRYFPEGNCFVCHHDIAQHLYGNITLYQCLNEPHSLDAVWFSCYHDKKTDMGSKTTLTKKVIDNIKKVSQKHPAWPKNNLDGGNQGHPDNMLEHCFERIIFKVAQKLGYCVFVIPCSGQKQHMEKTNDYTQQINTFMKKTI